MPSQMEMQKNHHGNEVSDVECVAGLVNLTVYCFRRMQVLDRHVRKSLRISGLYMMQPPRVTGGYISGKEDMAQNGPQ